VAAAVALVSVLFGGTALAWDNGEEHEEGGNTKTVNCATGGSGNHAD
jgi:hypothetical protein